MVMILMILSMIMMTLVSVNGNLANVSGQDAEDTITDVEGSDCDKCCNTFNPSWYFQNAHAGPTGFRHPIWD